jgi:ADP-ribosylation factor protein 1
MEYGGRSSDRPLRQIYLQYATGIIFVIDSTDREWTDEVRGALHRMLNARNVQHKSVLILANKQDLPNAMNVDELREKLDLNKLDGSIKWHLQPTSAIYNQGIYEGLKWLADSLKEKTDPIQPIVETINDAKTIKNHFASIFKKNNLKRLLNRFF